MANRKQSRRRGGRLRLEQWLPKSRARRLLLGSVALVLVTGIFVFWFLYSRVSDFLEGRSPGPIRIYSDSLLVRPGLNLDGLRLGQRLRRLGYEEVNHAPVEPAQFRSLRNRFDVVVRSFVDPDGEHPEQAVRLDLGGGAIRGVRRLEDGLDLGEAAIGPELLGTYSGGVLGERKALELAEYPRRVVAAILAAEDARFATHPGVDVMGIVRAAWANLRGGGVRQGGSTITQQLAKNLFLSPERTLVRKVTETVLAFILEARMTKEEILEAYLNNVYLGQSESIGIYGVGQGARAFFGKETRDLTVSEAATIAGVIHSPNADSPLRHPERARARRDQVLQLMADNAWISAEELEQARNEPVEVPKRSPPPLEAPFFVDEVLRRIARMGYDTNVVRGLAIYTTLDLETQHLIEQALTTGLESLERSVPRLAKMGDPLEAAMVVLDPHTGFVRGLAGGRDFARSQFNRVTRSRRQPGSAFKPFVYLTALDDPEDLVTPATVLRDEPLTLRVGNDQWTPENYDGQYLGDVTVRAALEDSRNIPTVELAQRIGIHRVTELAQLAGLGDLPAVPAVALGSAEVSLIDLVGAYTVFPNLGSVVRPALIRGVVAADGTVLYKDRLRARRVATAPAAFVTNHLLEGVVQDGTGAAVRRLGITRTVAGKTGTTNDAKDAWFIGYSPDLVAGVWVGFDDGTPIGLTGAKAALPLWVAFMREGLKPFPDRPFEVPSGIVFREVDRHSGLLSNWLCPDSVREAFVAGSEPLVSCDGRRAGEEEVERPRERAGNWLERLFEGR
ncbi:MAG: PBP1A family penicillin-binding protein [Candidatus Binatia bacterium]